MRRLDIENKWLMAKLAKRNINQRVSELALLMNCLSGAELDAQKAMYREASEMYHRLNVELQEAHDELLQVIDKYTEQEMDELALKHLAVTGIHWVVV